MYAPLFDTLHRLLTFVLVLSTPDPEPQLPSELVKPRHYPDYRPLSLNETLLKN